MDRPIGSVAFAVDANTVDLTAGDRLLAECLRRRGVDVHPLVWGTAPPATDAVLLRSTWDYVDRVGDFRSWLDELDAVGATVINPTAMLRWNSHKGYLGELAARGVAVVPTEMVLAGSDAELGDVMTTRGWTAAVVKPAIGASARQTVRVGQPGSPGHAESVASFRRLVAAEDVLVQPFVPSIQSDGEISVIAIGGDVTHAVVKRAMSGEWRVQSEYGGSASGTPVTSALEEAAAAAVLALDEVPTYARIDLVEIDGLLHLMELELIEPELFFELAPHAADQLAALIAERIAP